jgi:glycosyltransferase involved in cell wall biosynthesis
LAPELSRLKVCHLITQLELGGAQQNTLYTVRQLDRTRYDPFLVSGPGGMLDDDAQKGAWNTVFVQSLVRPIHPIKDIQALIHVYLLLRKARPHILHTHSSKAGILGRIAGYLAGVPVIVHTFHGFGFTPDQAPWMHRLFVGLEKFCARLSTHLIYVAKDNQDEARALGIGPGKPSSVIHSGIKMLPVQPISLRQELGLTPDAWMVVSVGNFKPQKNPLDLIRTAQALVAKAPNAHLIIVGDGPLRPDAEALAQALGIQANVHFLGWRRDAPAITAAADAFLLTSLWEGLPRALVEAATQNIPAVAYAVNGVKDILVDWETGYPVEPGQWTAAAEKLLWIKEHPMEARIRAEAAFYRVKEDFNIDRMVRAQESLYADLYDRVPLKEVYGLSI